jgi:AraC family transcriptional regulator
VYDIYDTLYETSGGFCASSVRSKTRVDLQASECQNVAEMFESSRDSPVRLSAMSRHPSIDAKFTVPGFNVRTVRVAPSEKIDEHRHDHPYLALVARGSVTDESGGESVAAKAGDALFHPGGCFHRNIAGPDGADGAVVELDPATMLEFGSLYDNHQSILLPASRLDGLPLRIAAEMRSSDKARDFIIHGLLWQLLALGSSRTRVEGYLPARWLGEATRYIDEHLTNPLSLAEIASSIGVRPLTLSRHFRAGVGLSLRAYIRNRRVDAAAERLRVTRMSIADVAVECGFNDQAQFARAFRSVLGVTASDYRRMSL